MSFLSILLVASAFYFANARPDVSTVYSDVIASSVVAPEVPEASKQPETPKLPDQPSVPAIDNSATQDQMVNLMNNMSQIFDQFMTPFMTKLKKEDQDGMRNMCMNGIASYINYLLLLISEKVSDGTKTDGGDMKTSPSRDEMIIEFESFFPLDTSMPYIAETPALPAQ